MKHVDDQAANYVPVRGPIDKPRGSADGVLRAVEKGGEIQLTTLTELLELLRTKTDYLFHIEVAILPSKSALLKTIDNERDAQETIRRLKTKPTPTPETGTAYVNGSMLGPAERDPVTGNLEQGPHVTKRAAQKGDIAVLRVDQSPMNPQRWELTLSCGHSLWVTATKRPQRKTAACATCAGSNGIY